MSKTPEGKVKDEVKAELRSRGVHPFWEFVQIPDRENCVGFYWMPVQGPYAVQGVHDICGCIRGVFFSLETKAPNNKSDETTQQGWFRLAVTECGGIALTGVRDAKAAVAELFRLIEEKKSANQT
jgi:hypothetical protein